MKPIFFFCFLIFFSHAVYADLKYQPIKIELKTEKDMYQEGDIIALKIVIHNTDPSRTYPFLLPKKNKSNGQKLFYVEVYDRAKNSSILRYSEDRKTSSTLNNGDYEIKNLRPLESIEIPFYLNETDTSFIFNHQIGAPLFAGIYQFRINYQTFQIKEATNLFHYYNHSEEEFPDDGKIAMSSSGLFSNFLQIKIKRTADTVVNIAGKNCFIKPNGDRYLYLTENLKEIVTDERCMHITNIPPDSFAVNREYFYSYFKNNYAEYVNRFDDGDVIEYRKFRDECPDYLYTEKFNENKQRIFWAYQLSDKSFYQVSYKQPGSQIEQETYCSFTGTNCKEITYYYGKNGEFKSTKTIFKEKCVEVEINGQKHYYQGGVEELEGK
ncbi:MAG: hypothetical protein ACOVP1_05185 [Bacteroidia bacterium]